MIVFADSEGRIKAVGYTNDTSLIPVEINDEGNPFVGWSAAKICCYQVQVVDGQVMMMTPYQDSRILDSVDFLGKNIEAITPYTETKTAYIGDKEMTFYNIPHGNVTVYFGKPYGMKRIADRIELSFDPLDDITEITISVV